MYLKTQPFLLAIKCNIFFCFYLFKMPKPVFYLLFFLLYFHCHHLLNTSWGASFHKAFILVHAGLERRAPGRRHRHVGGAGLPVTWGAAGQELPGCPGARSARH